MWSGGYSSTDCSCWRKHPELSSLGVYSSVSRFSFWGSLWTTCVIITKTKTQREQPMHVFNQNKRSRYWPLILEGCRLYELLPVYMCLQTECGPLRPTGKNMMQRVKVWTVCCQCWFCSMILTVMWYCLQISGQACGRKKNVWYDHQIFWQTLIHGAHGTFRWIPTGRQSAVFTCLCLSLSTFISLMPQPFPPPSASSQSVTQTASK